ncbi:hypothetical protein ATANTOWER_025533, partial [Ataeniobius toweri]|nr:hypothetical protein [Ataeniobius toweri]
MGVTHLPRTSIFIIKHILTWCRNLKSSSLCLSINHSKLLNVSVTVACTRAKNKHNYD